MHLLIVEDDTYKYSKIESVVNNVITPKILKAFDNVRDTVKYLESEKPDKIILDMSLPSHKLLVKDGSPLPMPAGGIEIIFELNDMEYFDLPIFILTQYHEIEIERTHFSIKDSKERLMELYNMNCLEVVYYESESFAWQSDLGNFLKAPF